jgi:hypothetical protein
MTSSKGKSGGTVRCCSLSTPSPTVFGGNENDRTHVHRAIAIPRKPGLHHVFVEHQASCGFHASGRCNCTPAMRMRTEGSDDIATVGLDGSLTPEGRRQ